MTAYTGYKPNANWNRIAEVGNNQLYRDQAGKEWIYDINTKQHQANDVVDPANNVTRFLQLINPQYGGNPNPTAAPAQPQAAPPAASIRTPMQPQSQVSPLNWSAQNNRNASFQNLTNRLRSNPNQMRNFLSLMSRFFNRGR